MLPLAPVPPLVPVLPLLVPVPESLVPVPESLVPVEPFELSFKPAELPPVPPVPAPLLEPLSVVPPEPSPVPLPSPVPEVELSLLDLQSVDSSTALWSLSHFIGSTVEASAVSFLIRTSKCRWGPVE